MKYSRDRNLLLTVYFSFYYVIFLFYFLDHRLLSQYHPIFFNYNRDLTELSLIASGLPRYLIAHPFGLWVVDLLVLGMPAVLVGHVIRKGRFPVCLGVSFCLVFILWLLLANLFWQVDHEPFMLYVFLSLAFCTNEPARFRSVLTFCRYYFLYIFFTAAMWKIIRGAVFNPDEMSRILLLHHADVLTGSPGFWRNPLFLYLISHPVISQLFYIGAVLLELFFVVGFFTRRFDRLLIGLAVLFVVADLFLMRIPYLIILMGSITLWIGSGRRRSGIVIYETTHHENLPALLDLSEAHFDRVAVFLTTLSFNNLSGIGTPKERWPKTEFIVQYVGLSNRVFIRQLFGFIRRNRYGHLHLRTLDNNLLFFAIRLLCRPDLQTSLTVHAVNEYFHFSFGSFKAITESAAKIILHRRIRHYTFFLPAITSNFRQRLPGSVAVCIPSRFYTSSVMHHRSSGDGSVFRIVIPGSVDPHRRDYEDVATRLASYLSDRRFAGVIELTILGDSATAYGKNIIPLFQRLSSDRFRVRTFTGYVPAAEYEKCIASADLLWSPLRAQKTSDEKGPEVYGQSIASGLTADLQLGCNPVLAPDWLQLPQPFSEAVLSYSSDSSSILDRLLNEPGFLQELRQNIDKAFSAHLTRANFDAAFLELMDLTAPDEKREERRNNTSSSVIHNSQQPVIE